MNDEAAQLVDEAAWKAEALVAKSRRGAGGTFEEAMARASSRWRIPFQTLWSLRYRPPKDLRASIYVRILNAYDVAVVGQTSRLNEEVIETKRILGNAAAHHPAVVAAEAFLRSAGKTADDDKQA